MKARITNRLQSALWGTIVSLEALGKASGGGTPIQSGLRAGVVILEIILLSIPSMALDGADKTLKWGGLASLLRCCSPAACRRGPDKQTSLE